MSLAGQRLQPDRYSVIPRTLTFLTRPGEVLLMRVPPGRGAWAGRYNGIGGHIERGEDPQSSAIREVREETGFIVGDLQLRGVVLVDTGGIPGIALYLFTGEGPAGPPAASVEGTAEWIRTTQLAQTPLVEDLPTILPRLLENPDRPFSAVYTYSGDGALSIRIAE
jgi:8-oxo-dGTP diphosphatase